jgi:DB module
MSPSTLQLTLPLLALTAITSVSAAAAGPRPYPPDQQRLDSAFQSCCGSKQYASAFFGQCTYTALADKSTLGSLRVMNVSPYALREWVECASQGRNNTQCCVDRGITE